MVLDAVGSERAAILAEIDTSPAAIFFAATRPGRTSALILVHASAKYVASDDYPIGIPARMPRRSWPRSTGCGHRRHGRDVGPSLPSMQLRSS